MPLPNIINRESRGFLSLFRAKVGGKGPEVLKTDVQPVIDITQFLASTRIKYYEVSGDGTPPGSQTITVPSDETWLLHWVNAAIYSNTLLDEAQSAVRLLAFRGINESTSGFEYNALAYFGIRGSTDATATQECVGNFTWTPRNFILPPGTSIQNQSVRSSLTTSCKAVLGVGYTLLDV
jgi:hypothetical protein